MKNTGIQYEKLVQQVFSQIINQDRVNTIEVQQNIVLQGKITKHQIDVYWKFEVGGFEYQTIIQAKDWSSKATKGKLLEFKAVIDDLPGATKGIFVCRGGFQKGALEVANAHGICAYELRSPKESDWDGYIKRIGLKVNMISPEYELKNLAVDKEWAARMDPSLLPKGPCEISTNPVLFDGAGNERGCLAQVICRLGNHETNQRQLVQHDFEEDTFILIDGKHVKLKAVCAEIRYYTSHSSIMFDAEDFISCVLKDVLKGEIKMFKKTMF